MDDKDWRILKTIAEEKNITKAAARLFISQPALTYRLKNIEEEFGTQVVSRVPSGVVFTPQGDFLLAYASEMLHKFEELKEQIKNMENKVQGVLRLGSSGVFAHFMLPKVLKGFLELYPEVEISLKTALSYQIIRMLEKQEITVAIVRGEHGWEGERFLLSKEPVCLVSRERLELNELLDKPYIRYSTDTSLQKMLEDWWRKNYNAPPRTTMEVNTMDTAREMVLNGLGWSILPSIGLPKNDTLFSKELFWPDGKPLIRNTWVLCSNGALELKAVTAFLEHLKQSQFDANTSKI
ncbi:MAG: LysR family transcriptional regulator [Betaproteobacteria bacterium]